MLSYLATWFWYFYYLICFLLITFMAQRKPVSLWITIITSPNWPLPIFLPTMKSLLLNIFMGSPSLKAGCPWVSLVVESTLFIVFLGLGGSMIYAGLNSAIFGVVGLGGNPVLLLRALGESMNVLDTCPLWGAWGSNCEPFFLNIPVPGSSRLNYGLTN